MVNSGRQCRSYSSRLFSVLSALDDKGCEDRRKRESPDKIGSKKRGRGETAIKIKKKRNFCTRGCARFNVWVSAIPVFAVGTKERNGASG